MAVPASIGCVAVPIARSMPKRPSARSATPWFGSESREAQRRDEVGSGRRLKKCDRCECTGTDEEREQETFDVGVAPSGVIDEQRDSSDGHEQQHRSISTRESRPPSSGSVMP